ncbi:MAG TPA: ATP-binding protein [Burkholderiaceae bacterium]|nr:ATP-binding protein [Burkholderiaceae bacterium]
MLAVLLQWSLRPWVGERLPFLIVLPAVLLTLLHLGRVPAFIVLGAGALNEAVQMHGDWSLPQGAALALILLTGLLLMRHDDRLRRGHATRAEERLALVHDELRQQLADMERLHRLSRRLMADAGGPKPPLQPLLDLVVDLHGERRGLLTLNPPGEPPHRVAAHTGLSAAELQPIDDLAPDATPWGLAAITRQRVVVEDVQTDARMTALRGWAAQAGCRAFYSLPLCCSAGSVMGALTVMFPAPRVPDAREIRLGDICAATASAVVQGEWARRSAAQNQLRFAVALESSAAAFTLIVPLRDGTGRITDFRWTYANPAAARLLRRSLPDLLDTPLSQALPGTRAGPDHEAGPMARYAEVVERRQPSEFELRASLEGQDHWLHVIASPLEGEVAIWFTDITARKQQQHALLEADRRKDEFLATLAHELRNPLAPIRQAALMARSDASSTVQKHWGLEVIDRQVQHMALLLEDLLDVSRITRGTLVLRKSRVELGTVVEAALESARPHLQGRRHQLTLDLPHEPVQVDLDPMRMAQVLGNLLTNAAKYTDPGGRIVLSARLGPDGLSLSVADNGIGMQPEQLTCVFEMFSQVSSAVGRSAGGLGIGLALARGLVMLHGGRLDAQSPGLGLGSRFTVHLPMPADAGPARPPVALPDAAARPGQAASPEPPLSGSRLLIADDNTDAAQTLAEWFRLSGYEVLVVYDGQQAVAAFDRFRPQAALLDLGMPGLSGLEAVRLIRQAPAGNTAVLIAITGWGRERDRHDALAAGFDHHVTKPVDPAGVEMLLVASGVAVQHAGGAVPVSG